jgi:non-heme chloroperoxidase
MTTKQPPIAPLFGSSVPATLGGNTVIARDGARIFYKDWGTGQPIVFSHGWPLSAADWDAHMPFFGQQGYRVIAHDRRGDGRSDQTWDGNEMDTYGDDLAALFDMLDLRDAIIVGHSTGGGEVVRYLRRHGPARVAKAAIIGAVPPLTAQTETNPADRPISADAPDTGAHTSRPQLRGLQDATRHSVCQAPGRAGREAWHQTETSSSI